MTLIEGRTNAQSISKGNEVTVWKDYLQSHVHCSLFTIATIWKKLKYPSMDKENISYINVCVCAYIYTHSETLFSYKQRHFQQQMDLEGIRLNEMSDGERQGFPGGDGGKEFACQHRRRKRIRFNPWVVKIPWRRKWQPTPAFLPGTFHGRGAWWAIVQGVAKSQTQLSN